MKRKCLAIGIILLFLATTCIPVLASEGKPDLIVVSMGFVPYGEGQTKRVAYATVKNVGDAEAFGTIYLKYIFKRMLFGTISYIDTVWVFQGGLEPGEYIVFYMIYEYRLPKFGFFNFKCTANPTMTIDESNSDNNDLSQNYVAILGQWKEIV